MQPRVIPSFRLIGLATCLLLGTLGCTGIHNDGALPSRAVRVANPPPVEPPPSAAAPSGTPMLLRIEDIGPLARIASERVLEAAARVHEAEASLRVEDDLYRHDKSTAAAVLDSELTLFESRVDAAHARYGMLVASAALKTATGGGLP